MTTVLSTTILPNSVISAGVRGKDARRNRRSQSQSGFSIVAPRQTRTLRQYEIAYIPMDLSIWQTIEGLFEATDAGAYGFLMEDPKDCTTIAAVGKLTLISGSNFQLYKRYTSIGSSQYRDRKITRPKSPIIVYRNGVVEGSASVNYTTGVVTITSPGADTFTWAGGFYVPVQFMDDELQWEMLKPGDPEERLVAGPSILLQEIFE
jgi:uncharacterized protein (TIGR02217 family)